MVVSREKQRFLKTHPPASPTRSFFLSAAKQEDLLQPVRLRRLCSIPFQRRRQGGCNHSSLHVPVSKPKTDASRRTPLRRRRLAECQQKQSERKTADIIHTQSIHPQKKTNWKKEKTSRPTILEPVPPFQSSTNLSRVLTKLFLFGHPVPLSTPTERPKLACMEGTTHDHHRHSLTHTKTFPNYFRVRRMSLVCAPPFIIDVLLCTKEFCVILLLPVDTLEAFSFNATEDLWCESQLAKGSSLKKGNIIETIKKPQYNINNN